MQQNIEVINSEMPRGAYDTAVRYQYTADMATEFRQQAAKLIGPATAVYRPSWAGFALSCAAAGTDLADGWLARKAQGTFEAIGLEMPDPFIGQTMNARGQKDSDADKDLLNSMLWGEVVDDLKNLAYTSALITAVNGIALIIRDKKMARLRRDGAAQMRNTNAIAINKRASFVLNAAALSSQAPAGHNLAGRIVRNTGLTIGTIMKLYGYGRFKHYLANQSEFTAGVDGN